jgi:HSP20 family protein
MALPSIFRGHPVGVLQDSGDPFGSLDRSVDRLFEQVWRGVGAPEAMALTGFAPRIDVVERDGEYLVTAELPGVEEKDFQIEINRNVLTLHGEKRSERTDDQKGWRWAERSYGSFRRTIQLPVEVEAGKASAAFKNGVLTVTLPKAESARVRQIPVTSA